MNLLRSSLLTLAAATSVFACASVEADPASDSLPVLAGEPAQADDDAVSCDACFPLESLPLELRAKADAMLLAALDTEGLYTILSDLKPMSSGFAGLTFPATVESVPELEELRAIVGAFHCTPRLTAGVQVFAAAFGGRKAAEALVVHRPPFAATIAANPDPFRALGIDPASSPLAAIDLVDRDPTTKRFAAYGHLFGYPRHAVDFFVAAAESERATGAFVERDFIHVPTFAKATGAFTYAVPKGHAPNASDRAIAAQASSVLHAYEEARAEHVKDGLGAARLVRAIFDDGAGRCRPENAAAFVAAHGAPPAPTCASAGGHCASDADCCSGDCHGDHCH